MIRLIRSLVRGAKLSEQRRLELEAANRELEGLYSRVKEIDELKATRGVESAMAALREANRKLEAIIEASPLAIITLDAEMHVESWSAAAERIFGWREVEVLGEPLPTVPADQLDEVKRNHDTAVGGRIFSDHEARRRRRDGTLVDVAISTAPLKDADGNSHGVVALVADITERKRAEAALAAQAATLREQASVIEQAYDAIFLRDPSNAITLWNRGAERTYGFTQDEARGRNPHELLKTEFPEPLAEIYAKLRREGYWEGELAHTRRDGARIVVESRWATLRDEAGEVTSILEINRDATERKSAEAALRESEERFAKAFEASPLALTISSMKDGRLIEVNETFTRMSGYAREEAIGRTTLELNLWANAEEREAGLAALVRDGRVRDAERRFRMKDGTEKMGLLSGERIEIGGEPCALTVIDDITEQKHAEAERERLAAQIEGERRRLRDLVANVPGVVWEAWGEPDEESQRIDFVSDHVEKMLGYTVDEWLATPNFWLTIVHPEDRERAAREARAKFESREGGTSQFRWLRKDGSAVEVESQSVVILDAQGLPVGMRGVTMDITERKAAEAAVRENERRLRIVTDNAPVLIAHFDSDVRYRFVNRPYAERLGVSRDEIVGRHLSEIIGERAYGEFRHHVEAALAGRRVEFEMEIPYEQIGRRFIHALYAPSFGEAGDARGFVAVLTDVTERRREEENQKFLSDATTVLASSLDYSATLDAVASMASLYIADYCLVDLLEDDGAITRLVTAHRDEARAEEWREMQRRFPLDPAADYTIPRVLSTGEPMLYAEFGEKSLEGVTVNREQVEELLRLGVTSSMIVPLRARGRTLGAISLISTDPDRRYTGRELRVAEELARRAALAVDNARLYERAQEANRAKDEFLATLSHELRTPLTPIIGWVHLLGGEGLGPKEIGHGLAVIDKNSQALSRLINDLLDMSAILNGKMRIDRTPLVVPQVVAEAVETVRAQADRRGVSIDLGGCEPNDPRSLIVGDRTRLAQVFWNLLTNAVKFSDDGGKVRVSCGREESSYAVRVEDDGIGIAADFLPHVFDRFRQADMSTTKLYGGLGIGLALVRSFVEAHGGTVRAQSEGPGRGSRFTVRLPLTGDGGRGLGVGEETAEARATQHAPVATKSAASEPTTIPHPPSPISRRALLVEDAPDTLEMLRLFFSARGFDVVACSGPDEALDVATRAHFDIIVTDIGLPNIDGYELLRRLRRESPSLAEVPALAVTGFAAESDVAAARDAGFDAHLAKPFDPASLATVVDELLARGKDPAGFGKGGE